MHDTLNRSYIWITERKNIPPHLKPVATLPCEILLSAFEHPTKIHKVM